ncbi:MAG: hypothetical protein DWP98_09265 [Bacteroidetes bacterium]|nr:MAG: hypothetical protein DWP98_09265 [Bacteroidota bacterium]MBL1144068.1 hypothetical protein [Bacteroidota bacterium]NOG56866.1 hypothetical protein [Bacteroidota bacterium]
MAFRLFCRRIANHCGTHGIFKPFGAELFATSEELKEVNSLDKTIMEKVSLIEQLSEEERQTLYTMLDAFVGKKKLKDTLSTVLNDMK